MVTCKVCNAQFNANKGLSYHVHFTHGRKYVDYVLEFEHDNVWPLCKCGCGKPVKFLCGKFMEYVGAHYHVGRPKSEEHRRHISEGSRGKKLTPEHRQNISKSINAMFAADPTIGQRISQAHKGILFDEEHKKKISETRSARIKSGEIVINREKISQTVTQRYLDGGFEWAKGKYVSSKTGNVINYRSSYELEFAELLDSRSDVIGWLYEPFAIDYEFNGHGRKYIPDFLVQGVSDTVLVEVKPDETRLTPMNEAKRIAASEYCSVRGLRLAFWKPGDEFFC